MKRSITALPFLLAALAAGLPAAAAPAPQAPFTARQAREGAELYGQQCAMCHGKALEGTFEVPALKGKFVANWAGRPLALLHDYIGRAMPQFAPASLDPADTSRIIAYLLEANGARPGHTPLPSDLPLSITATFPQTPTP